MAAPNGAGDDWHELVERHEHDLRRFIGRRMANPHLVDDALQETYLRAFRARQQLDGRWLRALARRASVDVYRREPPPGPDIDLVERAPAHAHDLPGSDEHVDAIASRQAVGWAFRRLSPRHRRLLVLRGVHGLTYEEIAALEGVTVEALTSALNRARKRLRHGIDEYQVRGHPVPVVASAGAGVARRLRELWWRAEAGLWPGALAHWAGATFTAGVVALAVTAPGPLSRHPLEDVAALDALMPAPSLRTARRARTTSRRGERVGPAADPPTATVRRTRRPPPTPCPWRWAAVATSTSTPTRP